MSSESLKGELHLYNCSTKAYALNRKYHLSHANERFIWYNRSMELFSLKWKYHLMSLFKFFFVVFLNVYVFYIKKNVELCASIALIQVNCDICVCMCVCARMEWKMW